MDDANIGSLPNESLGSAGSAGYKPSVLSYLAASWINQRIMNVADKADEILERLIDRGLLADGYGFAESPITDDMLMRMTPEQFSMLYETQPSEVERASLLQRMAGLKLPMKLELPNANPPMQKPQPLAPSPLDTLQFGTSV